jgi:hypothetical protein
MFGMGNASSNNSKRQYSWGEISKELVDIHIAGSSKASDPGLIPLSSTSTKYKIIENMMQSTSSGASYNIQKIEMIINTEKFKKYRAKREEIAKANKIHSKRANQRWLFHGSPSARKVALEGFKKTYARGGLYGAGMYFASQSAKSHGYTGGGLFGFSSSPRTMLLCRVILGFHSVESTTNNQANKPGFDSARAPAYVRGGFEEYIVYDEDQALPYYLITYT